MFGTSSIETSTNKIMYTKQIAIGWRYRQIRKGGWEWERVKKKEKDTSVIIFITLEVTQLHGEFKKTSKEEEDEKIKHILNSFWHSSHVQSPT